MHKPSLEISFQELFKNEYQKLCRFALAYMQDTHLAEDVVQETFIKIWEQKKDLIDAPNVHFYLVTAVKNNCISVLRKQKTQAVVYNSETPDSEIGPGFFYDNTNTLEEYNEQKQKIAAALNKLPPKCREVFLLVKLENLSYKKTAEMMGISVKTVENQMGKALKIFRELSLSKMNICLLLLLEICFKCMGVI